MDVTSMIGTLKDCINWIAYIPEIRDCVLSCLGILGIIVAKRIIFD